MCSKQPAIWPLHHYNFSMVALPSKRCSFSCHPARLRLLPLSRRNIFIFDPVRAQSLPLSRVARENRVRRGMSISPYPIYPPTCSDWLVCQAATVVLEPSQMFFTCFPFLSFLFIPYFVPAFRHSTLQFWSAPSVIDAPLIGFWTTDMDFTGSVATSFLAPFFTYRLRIWFTFQISLYFDERQSIRDSSDNHQPRHAHGSSKPFHFERDTVSPVRVDNSRVTLSRLPLVPPSVFLP